MSDELDELLRNAMKALDEQVPSGYFDTLQGQTLARLEADMQLTGPPENHSEPEEDSGLHDIRNLAASTKARLSNKRISTNPPFEGDALASSSGSFKNIALPQPENVVPVPEVDTAAEKLVPAMALEQPAKPAEPPAASPAISSR